MPQGRVAAELNSPDCKIHLLDGLRGIDNGYGEELVIAAERGSNIQRIGRAASVHVGLVAADGPLWRGLG